jgi:hypothetical protein
MAHGADVVPGSRMFPDFSIIQRYQLNTPIIAKCRNNREQGTGNREQARRCSMQELRKLRKIQRAEIISAFPAEPMRIGAAADYCNRASALSPTAEPSCRRVQ